MIKSKEDLRYYIEADRIALGRKKISCLSLKQLKLFFLPDYILRFQITMRKLEYYKNSSHNILKKIKYAILLVNYHRLSCKLGFSISINTFGPGLSIAHRGTIIVNKGAKIGSNCRLHADVNIGTEVGYVDKAPVIGDNVYIGPGVKIYGPIYITNNVAIGANAVVNKSFDEEYIAIAGVPAKRISTIRDKEFLIRATEILNKKSSSVSNT